jgi:hypothetical protein
LRRNSHEFRYDAAGGIISTVLLRSSDKRQCASFNRDSQGIPESRRKPIFAGMSEEERVSDARHALLFEPRLNNSMEYLSNLE